MLNQPSESFHQGGTAVNRHQKKNQPTLIRKKASFIGVFFFPFIFLAFDFRIGRYKQNRYFLAVYSIFGRYNPEENGVAATASRLISAATSEV